MRKTNSLTALVLASTGLVGLLFAQSPNQAGRALGAQSAAEPAVTPAQPSIVPAKATPPAQSFVPPAPAAKNAGTTSQYVLGPGDQLKIWVLGAEEITDKPVIVDPTGDIDLPLVGKVHVEGMTTTDLKATLVERFSKDLLKPQVSVEIEQYGSQPVSVMGAVNHPGVIQVQGRKTLLEMISLAEGLKIEAGPRVNIARQIQYGTIPLATARLDPTGQFSIADVGVKDLLSGTHPAENIQVFPNDVITVPSAEAVYVIGEVKRPGEIPMKGDGVSVLQALATAQGYDKAPAPQKSMIVRITPGTLERKEIPVDLRKIMAGTAEDVALRPNDILYVPSSIPKKVGTRALEAAVQAATGVAIWGWAGRY